MLARVFLLVVLVHACAALSVPASNRLPSAVMRPSVQNFRARDGDFSAVLRGGANKKEPEELVLYTSAAIATIAAVIVTVDPQIYAKVMGVECSDTVARCAVAPNLFGWGTAKFMAAEGGPESSKKALRIMLAPIVFSALQFHLHGCPNGVLQALPFAATYAYLGFK